jgi:4-hydroxy-2-oxoheptanedioate aldolase
MVQIETAAGVNNIDEICQVDGVGKIFSFFLSSFFKYERLKQYLDLVFIGPNDLALALLGYTPAKYTEPVFLDAIDKVVASAKKHRKKVGILAVDGHAAKKAKERFDLVVMSADIRSLQAWYRAELEVARS